MGNRSGSSRLGAIFGLIFVFAGLAAWYASAGSMIVGYLNTANWQEVPATIHRVELVPSYGDTTTYRVESQYTYSFEGRVYESDRVSLSHGSDNVGRYWQDLFRKLDAQRSSNEAFVLVNANSPSESILDRTLRWKTVVFGSMFLLIFCGIGGLITWACLRKTDSREVRLLKSTRNGITSNQKNANLFLALFGSVFLIMGGGMSAVILPDALREGQYGALAILLFVIVGLVIMGLAFRMQRTYRRFGPTPLFLDPSIPGVGGQLGASFRLLNDSLAQSSDVPYLEACLSCKRRSKSGKSTSYKLLWQEETPVYVRQISSGVNASFLFDIPGDCRPSKEWSEGYAIGWTVKVTGDFSHSTLGKFERTWEVDVEETAAQPDSAISIPDAYLRKAKQRSKHRVTESALNQIGVTEDNQFVHVHSRAGRHAVTMALGIIFGAVFAGVGVFTIMDNWWPGYLFLVIGALIAFGSIFMLGKSVRVKIDKVDRLLETRESWCGMQYATQSAELFDAAQFKIKLTSSNRSGDRITEFYALNFESSDKTIRIADGIQHKKAALALKDSITDLCFPKSGIALAA